MTRTTRNNFYEPKQVKLSSFPLFLNENPGEKYESITLIKRTVWDRSFPSDVFLYLLNANFNIDYSKPGFQTVSSRHPIARDSDRSLAYTTSLEFANMVPQRMNDTQIVQSAFMTGMKFYVGESPFDNFDPKDEDADIPYAPPSAFIEGYHFPFQVEISTTFMPHKEVKEYLSELKESYK